MIKYGVRLDFLFLSVILYDSRDLERLFCVNIDWHVFRVCQLLTSPFHVFTTERPMHNALIAKKYWMLKENKSFSVMLCFSSLKSVSMWQYIVTIKWKHPFKPKLLRILLSPTWNATMQPFKKNQRRNFKNKNQPGENGSY